MPVATALLFGIALSALKTVSDRLAFPMKLIFDEREKKNPLPIWAGCEVLAGGIAVLLLALTAGYFLIAVLAALGLRANTSNTFDMAGSVVMALGFGAMALHYVFSCIRWIKYPQTRSRRGNENNA
jgi:hypothetical protein